MSRQTLSDVLYLARDCDEHESLPGPDMKMIRGDSESRGWARGIRILVRLDGELAPQGVDIILLVIDPAVFHHVISDCRVCSISTDHEVKIDRNLPGTAYCRLVPIIDFQPSLMRPEVCPSQLVIEEDFDVWQRLKNVKQTLVEIAPVNCENCLGSMVSMRIPQNDQDWKDWPTKRTLPWTS
jgi:hypothetical protein